MAKKVKEKELKNLSFEVVSEIDKSFDSERFIKMRLRIMHTQKNPNMSYFSDESVEEARPTLANIPILANVVTDEDGKVVDFGAHDLDIEEHKLKEDEYKLVYSEQPIGLIPETNNYSIEEFEGRNYVVADGYIWKGYSNYAEDLIESKEEVKLSMEVMVSDYAELEEDKKYFDIKSYKYTGITFLGDKYGTGMLKAKAEKVEFNLEDSKEAFLKMANELKFALEESNKTSEDVVKPVVENDSINIQLSENEGENVTLENEGDVVVVEENVVVEEPTIESTPEKFELTSNEVMQKLNKTLGGYKREGDNYIDSWVMDYDSNYAYINVWSYNDAESKSDQYYLRCPYAMEGEECMADIGNAEKVYATYITKEEREKLESERNVMVADYEKQIESFKADIDNKDKTIDELTTFKTNVEKEIKASQVEELLGEFEAVLKDSEEFVQLKKNAIDMEITELEKELYALEGKLKHEKKNKAKEKKFNYSRVIVDVESGEKDKEDVVAKYYGEASKYFKK